MDKKILLIFDLDSTITEKDSFSNEMKSFYSEKEYQELYIKNCKGNWIDLFNDSMRFIKAKGYSIEDFNNSIDKVQLGKGIKDLFDFIKDNKEKCQTILFSSSFDYNVRRILNNNNLLNIFDYIEDTPSKLSNNNDDDQFIYILNKGKHNCLTCNPCNCKSNEFIKYSLTHDINQYKSKIFICDGENDLCLGKQLDENDYLMCRKNFKLYNKLFLSEKDEKIKSSMKCKIVPWTDGNELKKNIEILLN